MQSITNTIVRTAGIAFAVFALLAIGITLAPKAHAADMLDSGWFDTGYYDTSAPSYDTGSSYGGSDWIDTSYYDTASPASYDYGSGYSGCSSCGGGGFSGGGFSFGGSGFGGTSGGYSSTYAPTTVSNNVPTTIYAPSSVSTCTAPNSCNSSVDDHSIFNAPTTVTISGGGSSNSSYPVYVPVSQPSYPSYPVYNTPCYSCQQQPVVYPVTTRQPYVSLNQVPYTGLDLGPVGTVLYWGFLVFWCLVAAYLIVYKRVQTKVFAGLNSFLFGAPAVGTHAKVVMPATTAHSTHAAPKAYVAPVAKNEDAIDPFIASQIARNK